MLSRLSSFPLSQTMGLLLHKLYFAFDGTNDLTANRFANKKACIYIAGGGNLLSKMQNMHIHTFLLGLLGVHKRDLHCFCDNFVALYYFL